MCIKSQSMRSLNSMTNKSYQSEIYSAVRWFDGWILHMFFSRLEFSSLKWVHDGWNDATYWNLNGWNSILRLVTNPFKSVISLKMLFRCHANTKYEMTVVSEVNEVNSDPKYSSYLLASMARNRSTAIICNEMESKIATFFQFKTKLCDCCNGRISST